MRLRTAVLAASMTALGVPTLASAAEAVPPTGTIHFVSTTGTDSGDCVSNPCATVNYAESRSADGDTVKVAAGTYRQQVHIDKALNLIGAGPAKTIFDGAGLDGSGQPYGVIYLDNTNGGTAYLQQFKVTNPTATAYNPQPVGIALADPNTADRVNINHVNITEGRADPSPADDGPIGLDAFKHYAETNWQYGTVSGFYQGALFEDTGRTFVGHITFRRLIAVNDGSGGTYAPAGLFFLSDLNGNMVDQNASNDTFTDYAGFGIAAEAGYDLANCGGQTCTGSLSTRLLRNHFSLGGSSGSDAIFLEARYSGDVLNATLTGNTGTVVRPTGTIETSATNGASIHVVENSNTITQIGAAAPMSTSHRLLVLAR